MEWPGVQFGDGALRIVNELEVGYGGGGKERNWWANI